VNELQIFGSFLHVIDQIGYATHARMLVKVPINIPFVEGHLHYKPISAGKDLSFSLSCNVTDLVHWNKGHQEKHYFFL